MSRSCEQPTVKLLLSKKRCACGFDLSAYKLKYSWGDYVGGPGWYTYNGVDMCTTCWQKKFWEIQKGAA